MTIGPLFIIFMVAVIIGTLFSVMSRKRLRAYWTRGCSGRDWRRTFPDASTADIRRFLRLVVDAFGLPIDKILVFRPSDRVMDLYHACNPVKGWPDAMELESLVTRLEDEYNLHMDKPWSPDVTLGELFGYTAFR